MGHEDIFEKFKVLFPIYAENVLDWFPNGKCSIRVRISEIFTDFIFTYNNNKEWRFETAPMFINNTLKRKGE